MKYLFALLSFFLLIINIHQKASAIVDPFSTPNNKIGIHILFPQELKDAAKLINSNGGDWGYITIPIQAGEKDLDKWQTFMDEARVMHIIPILRLATEGDYFNDKVWRKPNDYDIIDFANFLNSLNWPTKNRYVVFFNEVNRSDEWGGAANASEYARILDFANSIFKARNPDFFIISAGLDNASANVNGLSIGPFTFLSQMNQAAPGIFDKIDGFASHSYPNPAFSKPPSRLDRVSIATYRYEENYISYWTDKQLPVFITETGWSKDAVSDNLASSYYEQAFTNVWNDTNLVAVTPFLLRAGVGQFGNFSFMDPNGNPTREYNAVYGLSKVKGEPRLSTPTTLENKELMVTNTKDFSFEKNDKNFENTTFTVPDNIKFLLKWILKI